jgi:hypothetical protein
VAAEEEEEEAVGSVVPAGGAAMAAKAVSSSITWRAPCSRNGWLHTWGRGGGGMGRGRLMRER